MFCDLQVNECFSFPSSNTIYVKIGEKQYMNSKGHTYDVLMRYLTIVPKAAPKWARKRNK